MLCKKLICIYQNKRKNFQERRLLKRKNSIGMIFILPSLVGVSFFVLIPFLDVIRRSFLSAVGEDFVGISNYKEIFTNEAFLLAGKNTLKFTCICIPLLLVFSLMLALLISEQGKISGILKSAYLVPMAIPVASIVLLWRFLFHYQGLCNGMIAWIHQALAVLPMKQVDWMNTEASLWILIFTYIWKNLGYDVVLWIAGLASIPKSIYEAAKVDGAGTWQCFFYITLPNLLPSFFTITVLSLLNSFKVFREAYLIGGDYPQKNMYLLQHLFQNWFRDLSLDKLSAAAVIVFFLIFLLISLLRQAWDLQE